MPASTRPRLACAIALVCGSPVATKAQQPPVPHRLGAVIASIGGTFGSVSDIRTLADGRVLVNDGRKRHLVLLDRQLRVLRTILVPDDGTDSSYGGIGARLLAFRADSSLFTHMLSGTFHVLDATGRVVRSMAPVPGMRFGTLPTGSAYTPVGEAGWSDTFGLLRGPVTALPPPDRPSPGTPDVCTRTPSNRLLIATNPATFVAETLATYSTGRKTARIIGPDGTKATGPARDPLYQVPDQWVVARDGAVAILRAQEYRIEWINADRTHAVGPRIPYEWKRLSDAEKSAIVDSVNAGKMAAYGERLATWIKDSTSASNGAAIEPVGEFGQGDLCDRGMPGSRGAGGGGGGGGRGNVGAGAVAPPSPPSRFRSRPRTPFLAEIGDVPDYLPAAPPIRMLADADNRVWIRPRPPVVAAPGANDVYDVIDRRGQLVERVEIPAGARIVGFAPGGIIYYATSDAGSEILTMARVR